MTTSWRRRLIDNWPLEPGDGLLIVFATMMGVVWAFFAFYVAVIFNVDLSLHIDGIGDVVRAIIFWPVMLFALMGVFLQSIGHLPGSIGISLIFLASGALPGALAGLLGVAWLHRG